MIKKIFISTVLSNTLLFSGGIPVIDAVANAQAIAQNIKTVAEWAKEAQRWADTINHYKTQLTAYENELLSKTGIRNSVDFMKDLNRLKQYSKAYGDDYLDLAQALSNPNSRVGNLARALFDKYNVFDRCENKKSWEKQSCENKLKREVTQIAVIKETNKMVDQSSKNLEKLSKSISSSQDIKESQDIANAINMELAQLQVVNMKMEMFNKQNEAQERAEQEQKERNIMSNLGKGINFNQ